MAERLLQFYARDATLKELETALEEIDTTVVFAVTLENGLFKADILLKGDESEAAMDALENYFNSREQYRVMLLPVEASLPRPDEGDTEEKNELEEIRKQGVRLGRVSREEIYQDLSESLDVSYLFIIMVILSTVVAAIGMIRDNVAVIIGSMVIAPLLNPNMALALATTLADIKLGKRALGISSIGVGVSLLLSIIIGYLFGIDVESREVAARTVINYADIALALASGFAGALSITTGASAAVIGVMVAVALLPPLVALGMLLGAAKFTEAFAALLLVLCNLICVNLAGVMTFLFQGLRPANWWEAKNAKRATMTGVVIWVSLLTALIIVIYFAQPIWES
jgi:uncharacterized hydrophobic protein (TIGR00341 family)